MVKLPVDTHNQSREMRHGDTPCGHFRENAGLLVIAVNPSGTSQDCSSCGVKVPKKLHERWHDCPNCGCSLDRDHNAAVNILNRADGHAVLKAQRLLRDSRIG